MVSKGIISIKDTSAQEILAINNAKLINEKGISIIIVEDEKIKNKNRFPASINCICFI